MALTKYVKPAQIKGDRLATADHLNKPFYIQPLEVVHGLKTAHDAEGLEPKLSAHAYDLENDEAYANIILFNGVLVENLSRYVGDETVIRFADVKTKDGKRTFRGLLEGTDEDFALAEEKMDQIKAAIETRLEELEAEAAEETATEAPATKATKAPFKR